MMNMRIVCRGIQQTKDTCSGRARIKGRRVDVQLILKDICAGRTAQQISTNYNVSEAEITNAVAYALKCVQFFDAPEKVRLKKWVYDKSQETWLFGDSDDGGGVFRQESTKDKTKQIWTGNAVVGNQMEMVGERTTKKEAMREVEAAYARMKGNT